MKNLNEKQLFLISVSLSVVVALGLMYGIYVQHQMKQKLEEEIAALIEETDTLKTKKVDKIKETKEDLDELRILQANELNFKLPTQEISEESFLVLIEDLQKFALDTHLEVSSTTHEYPKASSKSRKKKKGVVKDYETIRIRYDFESRFEDAVLFMNLLETYSRILQVESLSIDGSKTDTGIYDMKLTMAAYIFKVPEPAKKAAPKRKPAPK